MAVTTQDSQATDMGGGRRVAVGANVAIGIIVAAALLVAVNWFASLKSMRRDLASAGNYGLSDRTKQILANHDGPVNISILYDRDEKDDKQQDYINRLLDYCDELKRFDPQVNYAHLVSAKQREDLQAELVKSLGKGAENHKAALAEFNRFVGDLRATLDERSAECGRILNGETWLSDFPLFAQVALKLRQLTKEIDDAVQEIADLVPQDGLPKYEQAANRAKTLLNEWENDLKAIGDLMSELTKLARVTTVPDSPEMRMLRDSAQKAKAAVDSLRELVGADDAPAPENSSATLKAYADRGVEVARELNGIVQQVDQLAQRFPIVAQHSHWSVAIQSGLPIKVEVAGVLQNVSKTLEKMRLSILGVIDTNDPQQLKQAVDNVRRNTTVFEESAGVCEQILTGLADRLSTLDDASKALLDASSEGALFKAQMDDIDKVTALFQNLPELKAGATADDVKQKNALVITAGDKVRVVGFDAVWPVVESMAERRDEDIVRTFNGDSVISSAVLAMTAEKPFATVVLTFFEPPQPQQQNPFFRPPQSSIPSQSISVLRGRLEAANFKVIVWNLATDQQKPNPEDGTREIFLVLPPTPPAPPNPFGGETPPESMFDDKHRQMLRDALANNGRALFLATWEFTQDPMMRRMSTPPYGYGPLLEQDWGIKVDNSLRVLYMPPASERPGFFQVSAPKFQYLPIIGFTDHPIGKPLIGSRLLAYSACVLEEAPRDKNDGSLKVETVIEYPKREPHVAAGVDEIIHIVSTLNAPNSDGMFRFSSPPVQGPFKLAMTAERIADGKTTGKVVVIGFGQSLQDGYVENKVLVSADPVRMDPAPTENLDLAVNAVYWLNDTPQYIGRGPVPVPRIHAIPEPELKATRWFVWLVWPVLVFLPGVMLWFVRRR